MPNDRRSFLKMLAAGGAATVFPESIRRALAIPANNATGTIADVEHIVFMMQENRSFDHYLGTLNGVRGFSDPRAMRLPTGVPVFYQPAPDTGGYLLPFRPDEANLGLTFIEDLPHDWETTHLAWNGGAYDAWVATKSTSTMAHLTRTDIPYHYAIADAFTVCDAYHCALLGPTDPNRYYMWTGWVGNDGSGGGPVIDNAEAGYGWTTFPERLEAAGISWKIYQDIGTGLDAAGGWGDASDPFTGNYGDNALLYFDQYRDAQPGSPLYEKARTGTNIAVSGGLFDRFAADVRDGTLPAVSWVVAPEAYTEHPHWPANYGAWYVSQVLDALTADPEVWSRTVFIITYDENDGFFDHMVPPTPSVSPGSGQSTVSLENELYAGAGANSAGPYGMGIRVPTFIVSPWSKGGYVNSQLFDHTSLIRFVEQVFGPRARGGLRETDITPWRRAVAGDLTTCFDFRTPNAGIVALPSTASFRPASQAVPTVDYVPLPPAVQAMPRQEPGPRRARALPYQLVAYGVADSAAGRFTVVFENVGAAAAVFQVRSGDPLETQRTYTVEPGKQLYDGWSGVARAYDLSVYGPNGFFRGFAGSLLPGQADIRVLESYAPASRTLELTFYSSHLAPVAVLVTDAYSGGGTEFLLAPGQSLTRTMPAAATSGWYDVTVTTPAVPGFSIRLAGHIENGADAITDPLIG